MPRLSLNLLGSLDSRRDGAPLGGFVSDKVRALLAYLSVEQERPHRRSVLAGLLWPEQPEPTARHSLSQALSNLREIVGDRAGDPAEPPALIVTRDTVALNTAAGHNVDVLQFTGLLAACEIHTHRQVETCTLCAGRLAQAISLYRGDFLRGFMLRDSPDFDDWTMLTRERLHNHAVEALGRLAAFHEQRAELVLAQRYTARELELEPAREQSHRRLMRLLWLQGDRSAALRQYELCRQVLREHLGLEPEEETESLRDQIRADTPALESLPTGVRKTRPSHNLPVAATPFVGRETEVHRLIEMLQMQGCRLVTLTGPGGIGKTRLAIEAAGQLQADFAGGVCFVPLAPVDAPDLLESSIVDALDLPLAGGDQYTSLFNYLHDKDLLLVLDNFEQIVDAATLVAAMLERAPGVSILVTSRERLRVRGESVFELAGMSLPDGDRGMDASDAVRLFLTSARRVRVDFSLDAREQAAVARICRLVGGLPLGIELAAAWVETLTPAEIAEEIARSSDFLTTSLRDVTAPHRSLRAVFEQSWRLLNAEEQQVFRRLAVFRGGAGRDAAMEVAGATLTLLQTLLGKSLIYTRADTTGTRYELHDLLRQYALERLRAAGEEDSVRRAHLHHLIRLAEAADMGLRGARQTLALQQLETEHDNLRAALEWSITAGDHATGLRLAAALGTFWELRSHWREGRATLERALAAAVDAPREQRARALLNAGTLARLQGDDTVAMAWLEQSLSLYRAVDDRRGQAQALSVLGGVAESQGDDMRAERLHSESVRLFRASGDDLGVAEALSDLGDIVHRRGDIDSAETLYRESLARAQQAGAIARIAASLHDLAVIARARGDYDGAVALIEESLALNRQLDTTLGIVGAQLLLGDVYRLQGNLPDAAALHETSLQMAGELGSRWGIAWALSSLAQVAQDQGDQARARLLYEQSLALEYESQNQQRIAEIVAAIEELHS